VTSGAGVSAGEKKKKRGRRGAGRCGKGDRAAGPAGPKGKLSTFFLFPNLFQNNSFLNESKPKSFKLFTKFYKSFRLHTSNQKLCKAK
jgi:hypothetical protein